MRLGIPATRVLTSENHDSSDTVNPRPSTLDSRLLSHTFNGQAMP